MRTNLEKQIYSLSVLYRAAANEYRGRRIYPKLLSDAVPDIHGIGGKAPFDRDETMHEPHIIRRYTVLLDEVAFDSIGDGDVAGTASLRNVDIVTPQFFN